MAISLVSAEPNRVARRTLTKYVSVQKKFDFSSPHLKVLAGQQGNPAQGNPAIDGRSQPVRAVIKLYG